VQNKAALTNSLRVVVNSVQKYGLQFVVLNGVRQNVNKKKKNTLEN